MNVELVRVSAPTPALDALLIREDAAAWMGLTPRGLTKLSQGPRPAIPAFRINSAVVRFHPRTILAKMARDAGVPMETVAASYGITQTQQEAK